MGWRGFVRSVSAAHRRSVRADQQRRNQGLRSVESSLRDLERETSKIERNAMAIVRRAEVLEEKLLKNFIKTVNLRYEWENGFKCDPLIIREGTASITAGAFSNDKPSREFSPKAYEVGPVAVEMLGLLVTQWGTALAIRIRHHDPQLRIPLNWVKSRTRAKSAITLIDEANEELYLPVWSDLDGFLEPNIHRIGLVLFERFRRQTCKLSMRLNLPIEGTTVELRYGMEHVDLETEICLEILKPTLTQQTRLYFEDLAADAREKANAVMQEAEKSIRTSQRSGCLVLLFLLLVIGTSWFGLRGVLL